MISISEIFLNINVMELGTPPNNQRVTITNKYTTTDTGSFYGRLRESYGVIYVPTPTPHADTVFVTSNDTIYYTNLMY